MGPKRHAKGNLLMVLASVAAIATAGGAIWGLEKADSGLSSIEDRTQDVATDLRSVSKAIVCARKSETRDFQ